MQSKLAQIQYSLYYTQTLCRVDWNHVHLIY